jgi:hypothetical protein
LEAEIIAIQNFRSEKTDIELDSLDTELRDFPLKTSSIACGDVLEGT